MFDVFYSGVKPNLFAHEQEARDIEHARELSRTRYFWWVNYLTDYTGWDFLWEPVPWENKQRHAWSSQHHPDSGTYLIPKQGYTDTNYRSNQCLQMLPDQTHWFIPKWIDSTSIDFSWHPDPRDPPYIYMFDTKWHWDRVGGPEYRVPGATDVKYVYDFLVATQSDRSLWNIPEWIDPASIDYTWVPNPTEPPYIYEFPVEWGWNNIGGPEYRVPGATDKKYTTEFLARTRPDPSNFVVSDDLANDDPVFRWRPNPTEPPYIYVFGNQWWPAEIRESARYTVPDGTQIKYVDDIKATRLPDPANFVKLYDCDFDHSWEPDPGSPPYIYVFGNQYYSAEVMPTVEYHMPGATERKYMDISAQLLPDPLAPWKILHESDWDYTWRPEPGSPPYIYVFGNQWWPSEKMPTVEYHMPGATERKYMPGPVGNLPVDMTLWYIPEGVDVRDMDFSWVPDPGEPPYTYQFATQHQKTGGPQYCVPGATEVKYLDMMRAEVSKEAVPVFEIDHLDGNAGQIANTIRRVRYFDNYRDTLIRLARSLKGEYEHVWVCSSVCDYTNFDFSWHPETWQSTMLHVFASDGEKFGDTFYMHVPTFAERAEKKELLEWYSVNYVPRRTVPRRPLPVIQHTYDTHVEAVNKIDWIGPLAVFSNGQFINKLVTVPLWREKTKTIVPLSPGASNVIVPKTAVPYIKEQLYDYSYIDKTNKKLNNDTLQDVVFISYDEPDADQNWKILKNQCPRAIRVHGIKGMETALEAAADASSTPWYFAVFAKTKIHETFDFSYAPDYMQQPKHYIFNCLNTVNGLEYGHMGIVLYNSTGIRKINAGNDFGIDYTLSFPHESVPVLSCYGSFDQSPYHTWRTAFRESAKLAYFENLTPTVEGAYRLKTWLSTAQGPYAEWCLNGARDGVEFFESTGQSQSELKKSFRWEWLRSYFTAKYGELE